MLTFWSKVLIMFSCFLSDFRGECFEKMMFTSHPWNETALYPADQPILRTINGSPHDLQGNQSLYNTTSAIYTAERWAKFYALASDYDRNFTYIHEYVSSVIFVVHSVNFSDSRAFHTGVSGSRFNRIAVDWISDVVYWTDVLNQWVCMQPGYSLKPDDTQYKVLYTDKASIPHGIALDPFKGYDRSSNKKNHILFVTSIGPATPGYEHLFWSDIGPTKKIVRMSLAGTDIQDIITTSLNAPISLAVDLTEGRLYWVDLEEGTIEYANYDGGNRTVLKRRTNYAYFDISIYKEILVVTELNLGFVYFYNKYTGDHAALYYNNTDRERYYNVAINSPFTQPFAFDTCLDKGCEDICVAGGTTNPNCLCREGWSLQEDGRSCLESGGDYYRALIIANTSHICMFDVRSIMTDPVYHSQFCFYQQTIDVYLQNELLFIDVDMLNRRVIFATKRTINAVNIHYDTTQSMHQPLLATVDDITSIAYDWSDQKIYWTQGGEIGSINIYSLQSQTSKLLIAGLSYPRDLLVLPQDGVIVWTSGPSDQRQIERCNVDGSGRAVLVAYNDSYKAPRNLAADRIGERLFWVDNSTLWSCKNDGSNVTFVNRTDIVSPDVLEIYKSYIILAKNEEAGSTAWVVDKRPSHPIRNILSQDFGTITGILVLDELLQTHITGPCDEQNGGCEHICLVTGYTRRCECEFGYQLQADGMACYSEPFYDNFILVGDQTNLRIYQSSLNNNNEFRGLNTGPIKGPTGVAFNHVTNHVVWGEESTGSIKTSLLNGGNAQTLLELGFTGSYPERFAIDFSSGNIYFTFAPSTKNGSAGIGVISKAGKHKTILYTGEVPQAIAIDPELGMMFWSDMGSGEQNVKKSAMDGSTVSVLLSNVTWPRGLTLDTKLKLVYVFDGFIDELFQCYYTGGCILVYKKPFEWPVDIDLLGEYLYYTSWNHQHITKLNRMNYSDTVEIGNHAELGRFYTLYVYSSPSVQQTAHTGCVSNHGIGPCSTFCLPRMSGYSCGCENGVRLLGDGLTCENMQTTTTSTTTTTTTTTTTKSTSISTTTDAIQNTEGTASSSDNDKTILAGALSGGILFLCLIIGLLVCLLCRMRRNQNHQKPQSSTRSNAPLSFDSTSSSSVSRVEAPRYDAPRAHEMGNIGEVNGYLTMGEYQQNSRRVSSNSPQNRSVEPVRQSGLYHSIDPRRVNPSTRGSSQSSVQFQPNHVSGRRQPPSTPNMRETYLVPDPRAAPRLPPSRSAGRLPTLKSTSSSRRPSS